MANGRDQTERFLSDGLWEHGFDDDRIASPVRSVQFHPTLFCEDFLRGWRPSGHGGRQAHAP